LLSLGVGDALGDSSQFFVGGFFFFQRLTEEFEGVVVAHLFGSGAEAAVGRDFVMFNFLG